MNPTGVMKALPMRSWRGDDGTASPPCGYAAIAWVFAAAARVGCGAAVAFATGVAVAGAFAASAAFGAGAAFAATPALGAGEADEEPAAGFAALGRSCGGGLF